MIDKKTVEDFAKAMVKDLNNSGYVGRTWDIMGEATREKVVHGVRAGFRAVGVKSEGDPTNDTPTEGQAYNPVPEISAPQTGTLGGNAAAPKGWPAKQSSNVDDEF